MKSILFYVTLLTLFSLMIVIILNNQQRIPPKALTVHTFHSYLYHEDMTMELSFYINDAK
ncbi:MAG: hypothetical protein IH571_03590, partial [Acholeplasmataceae bacterium]|nr:hypothetical protein [Acholeplasmataceae bacterium]